MANRENSAARVLWTGGWDSTYRVLHLCKEEGTSVHPYYLYDKGRKSVEREMAVIRKIRDCVNQDGPVFPGHIEELQVRDMEAMRNDPEVHDALLTIKKSNHSGWQYYPLSCFVKQENLGGIELTTQKHDSLSIILDGFLEAFDGPHGKSYRVAEKFRGTPEHTVFSPFTFPIIDLSKQDMRSMAAAKGFADLMEETWFCHSPLKDGSPCGTCNPCIVSIRDGMGYRVPLRTRLRYRTRRPRQIFWDIRKRLLRRRPR